MASAPEASRTASASSACGSASAGGGSLALESSSRVGTTIVVEVSRALSVRILIVDDHAVVRTGLRLLLDGEEGLETVAEAGSTRDAIFEARKHKPDVILMDVVLPDQERHRGDSDVLSEALRHARSRCLR